MGKGSVGGKGKQVDVKERRKEGVENRAADKETEKREVRFSWVIQYNNLEKCCFDIHKNRARVQHSNNEWFINCLLATDIHLSTEQLAIWLGFVVKRICLNMEN